MEAEHPIMASSCHAHIWRCPFTFRAAVVAADAQPLGVALDVFVVELDAERPAQVRLPHCVLQPPPGIGEPVGNLQEEAEGGGERSESRLCCRGWGQIARAALTSQTPQQASSRIDAIHFEGRRFIKVALSLWRACVFLLLHAAFLQNDFFFSNLDFKMQ